MRPGTLESSTVPWEKVYIFISSTFNDMHAERDFLVKRVFPRLTEWSERRKLRMVDVDLRWGVTEEEATRNKNVVDVCLRRIDECRPFFLCFLGQRYGRVLRREDLSAATLREFPGLGEAIDGERSVTELEVLHALVRPFHPQDRVGGKDLRPARHAFFYLRGGSYLEQLPSEPPHLRRIYTDEAEKEPAKRDFLLAKNRSLRRQTVRQGERPVVDYEAKWSEAEESPELALSLACPALLDENIARWQRSWREAAGLAVEGREVAAEQAAAAHAFNERLIRGRLTRFESGGRPLEEVILDALEGAIAERFPAHIEIEAPSDLQQELDQQDQFHFVAGESFIERRGDFDELDAYVEGDSDGLFVLTAPAGMGKSILLANWIRRYRIRLDREEGESIHYRFIGQSDGSTTIDSLLRLLLQELRESAAKLDDEIPEHPRELLRRWPELLEAVGRRGPTILVLDALNQLETGLSDLSWLPRELPPGIKLVASFKRGEDAAEGLLRELRAEGAAHVSEVRPFVDLDDRRRLVEVYLSQYLKELDERHREDLIHADGAENPLFLKVVLSELRVFGAFGSLGEKIRQDFGTDPITAFAAMLSRLERDPAYSKIPQAEAVPILFGLMTHSRRGLSVDELTGLFIMALGREETDEVREAVADAIHLFLRQVRPFLARRGGRHDFFFESFKTAAQRRYVDEEEVPPARRAQAWHTMLADYFEKTSASARKADELPWQLVRAECWDRLRDCLTDLDIFLRLHTTRAKYDLMGYWLHLAELYDMAPAYRDAIRDYEAGGETGQDLAYRLNEVALFLDDCGRPEQAEPLLRRILEIDEQTLGSFEAVPKHLNNLAKVLHSLNRLVEAEPLYRRALELDEARLGADHPTLIRRLDNLALVLKDTDRPGEAEVLMRRSVAISETRLGPNDWHRAIALGNLATLLYGLDRLDEAEPLMRRALRIKETCFGSSHPEVGGSLTNLGQLLHRTDRFGEAEAMMRRALEIEEEAFGSEHPRVAGCLNNLAQCLEDSDRLDEAEALMRRALEVDRAAYTSAHPAVARDLSNLAGLLRRTDRADEAEASYRRAIEIDAESYGEGHSQVAEDLMSLTGLLIDLDRRQEAEPLLRRALNIHEALGAPNASRLATVCNNLAEVLFETNRIREAESYFRRALALEEEWYGSDHPQLVTVLTNLALTCRARERLDEAIELVERILRIEVRAYSPRDAKVALRLNNLGQLQMESGRIAQAVATGRRALEILIEAVGPGTPGRRRSGAISHAWRRCCSGHRRHAVDLGRDTPSRRKRMRKKKYRMTKRAIKKYIDHALKEAKAENMNFWQSNGKLVLMEQAAPAARRGENPKVTFMFLSLFVLRYLREIDSDREGFTDKEAAEYQKLNPRDVGEIYDYLLAHPLYPVAKQWIGQTSFPVV